MVDVSESSPLHRRSGPSLASGSPLEVRALSVTYEGVISVLHGVSMTVPQGKIVALLGSNGAGKSTVMKAISGLLSSENGDISGGDITYERRSLRRLDAARIACLGIALVPEGRRVFRHLTVRENLVAGAYTRPRGEVGDGLVRVFESFPVLRQRVRQQAGYLSGGEQQMLAIGRALMARPRLLMLDEPSLGLAPLLVKEIFEIIRRLNQELGTSVLLVEQNARRALAIADHAYVLSDGRIVLDGPAPELAANPQVQHFYLGLSENGERRGYRDL